MCLANREAAVRVNIARLLFGLALAIAGAFLVAQSAGTVNGGFIVGAPLAAGGVYLMTKESNSERQEERGSTNEN